MAKDQEAYEVHEQPGNVQFVYVISTSEMSKMMQEFTQNPRQWPAYAADRLEAVARHYNKIPQNAHYHGFDTDLNCLKFIVNNRSHGEPRWLENAKGFIRKLFT